VTDRSPSDGATEAPTPFRLQKARSEGKIARASDVAPAAAFAAFTGYLIVRGAHLVHGVEHMTALGLKGMRHASEDSWFSALMQVTSGEALSLALEPLAFIGVTVVAAEIIQNRGVVFSTKPLAFNFARLNPMTLWGRIVSLENALNTLKAVVKFAAVCLTAYLIIAKLFRPTEPVIYSAREAIETFRSNVMVLLLWVTGVYVVAALIDVVLSGRLFHRAMRMTKSEVTRETKDQEGDPTLKRRRKRRHRDLLEFRKSLGGLSSADVLVTNPTHFAVATAFNPQKMISPKVVSRGRDAEAMTLRRRAIEMNIPIIQDRELAQALYRKCRLGRETPEQLYPALARVYRKIDFRWPKP
jgi:flagellar biosynthetic protein FlhB